MLSVLELHDFQSHAKTRLELGRFTAIVGPSSSGKSAVVRALRVLANNSRGAPFVRAGTKLAGVSVIVHGAPNDLPDSTGTRVSVVRGAGMSRYELRLPDMDEQVFTKCGTSVPEAISAALDFGFDDLWLAGQFDRPFLLDETGASIARVLGQLTNVTMIYAAVREVNRRGSAAKSRHADRTQALVGAQAAVMSFADLPDRRSALVRAEDRLVRAHELETVRERLESARSVAVLRSATLAALPPIVAIPSMARVEGAAARRADIAAALARLRAAEAQRAAAGPVVEMPRVARAEELSRRRMRILAAVRSVVARWSVVEGERVALENAGSELRFAHRAFAGGLQQAGRCPTCGADTHRQRAEDVLP